MNAKKGAFALFFFVFRGFSTKCENFIKNLKLKWYDIGVEVLMRGIRKRRGFTLMELMIVILIIGILSAIVVPKIVGSITMAKRSAASAEHRTVISQAHMVLTTAVNSGGLKASELASELKDVFGVPADAVTGGNLKYHTEIRAGNVGEEGVVTIKTHVPAAGGEPAETKIYTIDGLVKD